MKLNIQKLTQELIDAGIQTSGCNSDGVVWGVDYTEIPGQIEVIFNEIQGRADVKAIIEAHDPTPDPEPPSDKELIISLQAQVAVLSKAVDTSRLTAQDIAVLDGGMVEEAL